MRNPSGACKVPFSVVGIGVTLPSNESRCTFPWLAASDQCDAKKEAQSHSRAGMSLLGVLFCAALVQLVLPGYL